jgi:guanylate kinase
MLTGWITPDEGALFVVSGPSGTGKSTLLKAAFAAVPGLEFSVSYTTRAPRPGERDGVDYHFVDAPRFLDVRAAGGLLESAEVYGRHYGTPRAPVEAALAEGRSIMLDIDVQGATQVRGKRPDAVTIFVLPPSLDVMRDRLQARGTDSEAVIERRIREADVQLHGCGSYDYLVMNDALEAATAQLVGIIVAELSRRTRRGTWVRRFTA